MEVEAAAKADVAGAEWVSMVPISLAAGIVEVVADDVAVVLVFAVVAEGEVDESAGAEETGAVTVKEEVSSVMVAVSEVLDCCC